ncbi:hypothetical protein [Sulfurivermis fontis]|uniref:hypothetical protein n=1 Tax=Sulfurivermis fontis TaxID=1972068 RepID=UPI000FDCB1C2|nr:hypothetical protein [Sulfurivermis fontis]
MNPTLNLVIPPQNKPGPGAFDTRPEAVRAWLEQLPLGHVGETARLLYLALHEVNRLDINIHHRLDFLEQLAPPLQGVLASLKPHYSGKPFPLAPKAARVAQLATELQAAMIIGYQIVMQQSDSLHWFRQRKWERVWTTALHRMLRYFSGIFCIRYQLHLPPPAGAWQIIHSAYRLLEENHLLDVTVPPLGGGESTTLGFEYKQLLLLAMLPRQRMQPVQLEEIRRHMAQWTAGLTLVQPANPQLCNEAYCIDLDQDQPPGPLWKLLPEREPNVRSLRLLHMVPLLEQIERQVRQQRAAAHITLPDGATLPRDLATVLLSSWLHPPQRSDARETARGVVHVVLGLREIHALLSGVTTPQAEEAPATASPELRILDGQADKKQSFARTLGFVGERDEEADIWDMVYTVRPREQVKSWSEVEVARSYTLVRGDLVNRSSGGFGLRFPAGRLGAVRDGDLVAVSTSEDTGDWSLGMVRWLHVAADGSIELGIKQLQQHVVPAAIRVEQEGQQSAPIDCLLGHAQEQLRVVLPCMTGLANKRLLLTSGGREIPISLFEPLEFSTVFQMFRCVENQARRAPSEAKPQAAADPFDKYKSVWDIL